MSRSIQERVIRRDPAGLDVTGFPGSDPDLRRKGVFAPSIFRHIEFTPKKRERS